MKITCDWLKSIGFKFKYRKVGEHDPRNAFYKNAGLYLWDEGNGMWTWQIGGTANRWQKLGTPTREFVTMILKVIKK